MSYKKVFSFWTAVLFVFASLGLVLANNFTDSVRHSTTPASQVHYKWNGEYLPSVTQQAEKPVKLEKLEQNELELPDYESTSDLDFKVRVNRKTAAVFKLNGMLGTLAIGETSPASDEDDRDPQIITAIDKISTIDETWRTGFEARMGAISEEKAVSYATMFVENTDDRLDDEIAWCLSHMTPQDLAYAGMNAQMIYDNASNIYKQAELLDYVEIVELDDNHTTLEYSFGTGDIEDSKNTIPYEIYYNGVVNMKMDWERVSLINPETGNYSEEPDGIFWRSYFMDQQEPPQSYANHPVFSDPNDLHGTNFPGSTLQSEAVFVDFEVGPLNLVKRASDNQAIMIEFNPKNYAQSVVATLVPVEQMAIDGNDDLLVNMLTYLNDGRRIVGSYEVIVLKEKDPFGQPVIVNTLNEMNITHSVIELEELDTLADTINFRRVKKLVIPSDQSLGFYQALADKRTVIEDLISKGLCLEFHGAVQNAVDRWDGIVMPGGFTTRLTDTTKADESYIEGGYSKLTELMENTKFVWDKEKHTGISGTRLFDADTFALDKIGYWASEILIMNVAERVAHMGGSPERGNQPVRLSNNHYGNCGEDQDVLGSASKTMLVPAFNAHNTTEDHVWNIVYLNDQWIPYQIDWSDEATRIDNAGISYDKQQGGGKDCACIIRSDGDGKVHSVIDLFSDYISIKINVKDENDIPVDGARVLVFSEAWQSTDSFSLGVWGVTDDNGEYKTTVGDNANYYLRVETSIGSYPSATGQVTQIVQMEDAIHSAQFEFDIKLNSPIEAEWEEVGIANISEDDAKYILSFTSELNWATITGKNGYTSDTTYYDTETAKPLWAIMSQNQMNAFLTNRERKALKIFTEDNLVELPKLLDNWYLLLVEGSNSKDAVYEGKLQVWTEYPQTVDGDDDMEEEVALEEEIEDAEQEAEDGDLELESETIDNEDEADGCNQINSRFTLSFASFLFIFFCIVVIRRKYFSMK